MKLDPSIRRALDETGLPWTVEQGKRHKHIRLAGRLAAILPTNLKSDDWGRGLQNGISQIRRIAKELQS